MRGPLTNGDDSQSADPTRACCHGDCSIRLPDPVVDTFPHANDVTDAVSVVVLVINSFVGSHGKSIIDAVSYVDRDL